MKSSHRLPQLVLACIICALAGRTAANEAALLPTPLQEVTHVRVVVADCRSALKKQLEISDSAQVSRLVREIELLRKPDGVWATKFGCDTGVTFLQNGKTVAHVHVFPCFAIEKAPVPGRRYFQYRAGFSQLPELSRVAKDLGKRVECQ